MADPIDVAGLLIRASVPTGLEQEAAEEVREVFGGREARSQRGRVCFELREVEELDKVVRMRSIDHCQLVLRELPHFCQEESTVLERLETLAFDSSISWDKALCVWHYYHQHFCVSDKSTATVTSSDPTPCDMPSCTDEDSLLPSPEHEAHTRILAQDEGETLAIKTPSKAEVETLATKSPSLEQAEVKTLTIEQAEGETLAIKPPSLKQTDTTPTVLESQEKEISFRVTCTRGASEGKKHSFTSMDAAKHFSGGVAQHLGWKVQLKNFDVEVLLSIFDSSVSVGIGLSKESFFKRNIVHFGPTTLRSTICHGLLRLAGVRAGDVVLDPMCGVGSLTVEGALAWPCAYHVAGDNHHLACQRTRDNLNALYAEHSEDQPSHLPADILRWDVRSLPLRNACADVIVTDLPFGKRSGAKFDNWSLYTKALTELGRVSRPVTARCVLLTNHNKALSAALQKNKYWQRLKTVWLNVGGLRAGAYILRRSKVTF